MNINTKASMAKAQSFISTVTYTRLPSGTSIVCEITLTNRHPVHGIASVVDLENYDEELGCVAAYNKAMTKVFEYVAFSMHTDIQTGALPSIHSQLVTEYSNTAHQLYPGSQND